MMIVGNGVYRLEGTREQIAILAPCFDPASPSFIRFPWDKLSPPSKPIPIGWQNLSGRTASERDHPHLHDKDGNEGHGITRLIDGRWWTAGVFWSDGRIYLDYRCEQDPELAREVMSAELAHSVDFFLPLTAGQKSSLMRMWHPDGTDAHSWWEKQDYGAEYYTLGGESFMAAFTLAYSSMTPYQSPFTHKSTVGQAAQIRAIVGLQDPTVPQETVVRIGTRPKYHRPTCVFVKAARAVLHKTSEMTVAQAVSSGLSPCLRCKPR